MGVSLAPVMPSMFPLAVSSLLTPSPNCVQQMISSCPNSEHEPCPRAPGVSLHSPQSKSGCFSLLSLAISTSPQALALPYPIPAPGMAAEDSVLTQHYLSQYSATQTSAPSLHIVGLGGRCQGFHFTDKQNEAERNGQLTKISPPVHETGMTASFLWIRGPIACKAMCRDRMLRG